MIILLVLLVINLKVNSIALQKVLKYFFIAEVIIIFVNYIFKFI